MDIARGLKLARAEAGMTQEDLARASDLKLGHILILESGKGNPTLSTLIKIAKGFHLRHTIHFLALCSDSEEGIIKQLQGYTGTDLYSYKHRNDPDTVHDREVSLYHKGLRKNES